MTGILTGWAEQILLFLEEGGSVMWPLTATGFLLWFALGYRFYVVRRGTWVPLEQLVETYRLGNDRAPRGILDSAVARGVKLSKTSPRHLRWKLDIELAPYTHRMGAYATVARTAVLIAPLLGLLGTVTGMIELFASFGTQTFFSQTGGIAQGIADALSATELGLAVAIPGIIVGRMLERRQVQIDAEIDRLKEILLGKEPEVIA